MKVNERLQKLRAKLVENNLDAYLITGTDYNQSEYVAPYFRTREFISGFSGSAGTVVVTTQEARLWVDSRYYIQGEEQIRGSEFILMKQAFEDTPDPEDYIESALKEGMKVGVEGATISCAKFKDLSARFNKKGIELVATNDLLSTIWEDRPAFPFSKCENFPLSFAGKKREDKLNEIRAVYKSEGASATLITSLDDIAWVLNLRAADVPSSPIFTSYMVITDDKAMLFTALDRFDAELKAEVEKCCEIREMNEIYSVLDSLKEIKFYYDDNRVNQSFAPFIQNGITGTDISTSMKAQKNPIELEGMRKAHYLDGVAYANFRAKLEKMDNLDEIAVSTLFEEERKRLPGYLEPSFSPISGFGPHGAMCHYSATEESSSKIDSSNLLVLDTGSHFQFGTTDLTRTLLFGEATPSQMRDYTLVLKGHLALASAWFIEGTTGSALDVLAKQYLWQAGMSFYHGTGHGVGCRLNVHEGPCNISSRQSKVALKEGMVLSNEPGLYKEGEYGIRIENLIAVQKAAKTPFGQFYCFENLTVVPYERKLIDVSILTDIELKQINSYHEWCYNTLKDAVDKETLPWLKEATAVIEKN